MAFISTYHQTPTPVGVHLDNCPNLRKLADMRQLRLAHPEWSERTIFFAMLQSPTPRNEASREAPLPVGPKERKNS